MIIIDNNDEIQNYLKQAEDFDIPLVRLDLDSYELAHGLDDDLIIVHETELAGFSPALKAKLAGHRGVIAFSSKGSLLIDNLIYTFNSSFSVEQVVLILNQLDNVFKENLVLKSRLFNMNRELSGLIGSVETELLRVKKFYEYNTPRRFKDIKGIKLISKYAAGESIGGEFFDMFENQNKIFLLMSDTSSYLASSSILSLFTAFKLENKIDEDSCKKLIQDIKAEMEEISQSKKKKLGVSLMALMIDLHSYELSGFIYGDFKLLSSVKLNIHDSLKENLLETDIENGAIKAQLNRGERLLVLSPGFNKSWSQIKPQFMVEELVNNPEIKKIDILDEIFFQLKKDRSSGFLPHDASAIMMEVQKNVMVQV